MGKKKEGRKKITHVHYTDPWKFLQFFFLIVLHIIRILFFNSNKCPSKTFISRQGLFLVKIV